MRSLGFRFLRASFTLTTCAFSLGALSLAGCSRVPSGGNAAGGAPNGVGGSNGVPGGGSGNVPGGGGDGNVPGGGTGPVGQGGNNPIGQGGETIVTGGSGGMVTKMACMDGPPAVDRYQTDPAVTQQVQTAMSGMTPSDLARQMRGMPPGNNDNFSDIFRMPDDMTRNIKGWYFRDGPRGVNLAASKPEGQDGYSTSFPVPMSRGASFDLDLELRIGRAIGDETLASGNTMMLAPTINNLRHPAWGRAQETYGEDPFLLGKMGIAFTLGTQEYVAACAKHYAANNIEHNRQTITAGMDEQTLREIYARHFEMTIRDGGVACIMAAYNKVVNEWSTQNRHLLNEILRDDFKFKGFVLSDWWAMPGGSSAIADATKRTVAAQAVLAGLDVELPWSHNFAQLEAISGPGQLLQPSNLTTAVSRILEQKFRFKAARPPLGLKPPTTTLSNRLSIENNAAHVNLAYEAAVKGTTLLKNENNTLPIKKDTVRTLAVLGATVPYAVKDTNAQDGGMINFVTNVRTGDLGSSRVFADPAKSIGPLAGIQAAAGAGVTVVSGSNASVAANADFIIVIAGLTPQDEGEEYTGAGDRSSFALDAKQTGATANIQNNLIQAAAMLNKPMAVVLEGGSVIDMPWLAQVPAVVMAWYPGMVGGKAIGELLFGIKNFSAKLPITWPTNWNQLPTFDGGTTTMMPYDHGYRFYDRMNLTPLYPFGHGLSYTTFEYSDLQVPCSTVTKNGVIDVKVTIKNTGTVAGEEVAFLFTSYPGSTARRPVKELKGFYRVSLDPGIAKQISIPVRVADLKYWGANGWTVDSGQVVIQVGPNAKTLPLMDTVTVN